MKNKVSTLVKDNKVVTGIVVGGVCTILVLKALPLVLLCGASYVGYKVYKKYT